MEVDFVLDTNGDVNPMQGGDDDDVNNLFVIDNNLPEQDSNVSLSNMSQLLSSSRYRLSDPSNEHLQSLSATTVIYDCEEDVLEKSDDTSPSAQENEGDKPVGPGPRRGNRGSWQQNRRYHATTENVKPGVISQELREALGLRSTELPWHIYRMRTLGYPPGWLRKAQYTQSEVVDCVTNENELKEKDLDKEQIVYDATMLIAYPGFNVDSSVMLHEENNLSSQAEEDSSSRYNSRRHRNHEKRVMDRWKELGARPQEDFMLLNNFIREIESEKSATFINISRNPHVKSPSNQTTASRKRRGEKEIENNINHNDSQSSKHRKQDENDESDCLDRLVEAREKILQALSEENQADDQKFEVLDEVVATPENKVVENDSVDHSTSMANISSLSVTEGCHMIFDDSLNSAPLELSLESFSRSIQQVVLEEDTPVESRGTFLRVKTLLKQHKDQQEKS